MTALEQFLDDIGRELERVEQPAPKRQRPRRRIFGGLALTAGLALALIAVVLSGGGPGSPLNVVSEAQAALSPGDKILYLRIRFDLPPTATGSPEVTEQWSVADPLRWRTIQHINDGSRWERSYAAGALTEFDSGDGGLKVTSGYGDTSPQVQIPNMFSPDGNDPDSNIRSLLASGDLVDRGELQVDGRTVRRLESRDTGEPRLRAVVYDVDPETFAPVGGRLDYFAPGNDKVSSSISFHVEKFERLDDTSDNAAVLRLSTNGSAAPVRESRKSVQAAK